VPVGIFVVQDISQRKLGDHFNGVSVKIMAQFVRGNQDGVEQLLDQRVTGLGLIEYITDELYWSLDLVHMPDLLALDDDGGADHPVGCCDVEQQSFTFLGHRQDQRGCEKLLEFCKSNVSFLRALELLLRLEELEERQTLFSEP
jgi:hypothetical protein